MFCLISRQAAWRCSFVGPRLFVSRKPFRSTEKWIESSTRGVVVHAREIERVSTTSFVACIVRAVRSCSVLLAVLLTAQWTSAAIGWSGFPSQVNANAPISFTVYEASGGPTPPKVSLYRNGSLVGPAGTQAYTYNGTAPSTAQTLTFYAVSTYGASSTITLSVVSVNTQPFGAVDPVPSGVQRGQAIVVSGWAADAEQGSPISRVDLLLDGADIGFFTL